MERVYKISYRKPNIVNLSTKRPKDNSESFSIPRCEHGKVKRKTLGINVNFG